MEIKILVSLSKEDREALQGIANALNGVKVSTSEAAAPATSTKSAKGKGKKAPAPAEEIADDLEDLQGSDDAGDDIEDLEGDDDADASGDDIEDLEGDADDEPAKIDEKQLAQLKKALNTFAGKKGKPAAVKILHKFAKVSQDVKADDFAKIMKALKV